MKDKAYKAYELAGNPKYDEYKKRLTCIVYKFFDKRIISGVNVNDVLVQELHKPLIKKIKRGEFYARFKDNIWAVDLTEMRSLFFFHWSVKYLFCVIDVFTKKCLS